MERRPEASTRGATVPEPILRSWERCARAGLDRGTKPRVEPMPAFALRQAVERSEALHRRCRPDIESLHAKADAAEALVILTDPEGVILDVLGHTGFAGRAAAVSLRAGVPWSEAATGTNAIGAALIERRAIEVRGREHYFEPHHILSCTAMPILGARGEVMGVLDLSGPASSHPPQALGLIRRAVDGIEHRAFAEGFRGETLRFHHDPALVGTAQEGVLVFEDGRLVAANRHGLALLALDWRALGTAAFETLFPGTSGRPGERLLLRDRDGRGLHAGVHAGVHAGLRIGSQAGAQAGLQARARIPAATGDGPAPAPRIVHDGPTRAALDRTVRLLDAGIPVLVQGETGTGKEVFARAAHARSRRARRPFVAVNCAALPESLIEAELFGYEAGAFTGARRAGARGLLREAEGGLLFLDEIGDMPLGLQSRLLRVLQEREVVPVGASRPVPLDVTLICATHRRLPGLVEAGGFRADLYFRIATYTVALAPLRLRPDRAELVRTLWHDLGAGRGVALAPETQAALAAHAWPGNLRQLAGTLRALEALAEPGETVAPDALPADIRSAASGGAAAFAGEAAGAEAPARALDAIARDAMRAALAECGGNVAAAARRLGISRSTLYRRCLSEDRSSA